MKRSIFAFICSIFIIPFAFVIAACDSNPPPPRLTTFSYDCITVTSHEDGLHISVKAEEFRISFWLFDAEWRHSIGGNPTYILERNQNNYNDGVYSFIYPFVEKDKTYMFQINGTVKDWNSENSRNLSYNKHGPRDGEDIYSIGGASPISADFYPVGGTFEFKFHNKDMKNLKFIFGIRWRTGSDDHDERTVYAKDFPDIKEKLQFDSKDDRFNIIGQDSDISVRLTEEDLKILRDAGAKEIECRIYISSKWNKYVDGYDGWYNGVSDIYGNYSFPGSFPNPDGAGIHRTWYDFE